MILRGKQRACSWSGIHSGHPLEGEAAEVAEEVEVAAGVVVQVVVERVEEQAGEAEAARVAALEVEGHAAGRAAAAGPAWAIHLTTTRRIRR